MSARGNHLSPPVYLLRQPSKGVPAFALRMLRSLGAILVLVLIYSLCYTPFAYGNNRSNAQLITQKNRITFKSNFYILKQSDISFCLRKIDVLAKNKPASKRAVEQAFAKFTKEQGKMVGLRAEVALVLVCSSPDLVAKLLKKPGKLLPDEKDILQTYLKETGRETLPSKENDLLQTRDFHTAATSEAEPGNKQTKIDPSDLKIAPQPPGQQSRMPSINSPVLKQRSQTSKRALPYKGECLFPSLNHYRDKQLQAAKQAPFCQASCLPKPDYLSNQQLVNYQRLYDIRWCQKCVMLDRYLSLKEVAAIETAGNFKLCPKPKMHIQNMSPIGDEKRWASRVRGFYYPQFKPKTSHPNLALVISQERFQHKGLNQLQSHTQARAITMTLLERLGYVSDHIIEKRDLTLSALNKFFDLQNHQFESSKGNIAQLANKARGQNLLIYLTGHGGLDKEGNRAFFLAKNSIPSNLSHTALSLDKLYQRLDQLPFKSVTLILDMGFHAPLERLVSSPNMPLIGGRVLPQSPMKKLKVITAGRQDQHLLIDKDSGLGLFTRHLITSMTGGGDQFPFGDQNGQVSWGEAYVRAAQMVRAHAVKSFGVFQNPSLMPDEKMLKRLDGGAGAALAVQRQR